MQHIVLVGEEFTGLLAEINAQRSPKAKERGEVSGEREKMRKLSSPVLAAENAAVFLNLLFFRL